MKLAQYLLSCLACYAPPIEYPRLSIRAEGNLLSHADYSQCREGSFAEFHEDEIVAYKAESDLWIYAKVILIRNNGSVLVEYKKIIPSMSYSRNKKKAASYTDLRKLP